MSVAVPGYVLVAGNQPAFAQRAGVSTLQWINMPSYDVPGCANQCTATPGCKAFDVCECAPVSLLVFRSALFP